jgi:hypothetical protein
MFIRVQLLGAAALAAIVAAPAAAVPILGLVGPAGLITFDSTTPGTPTGSLTLTGLAAGEVIRGIDTRPSNGVLYAFGQSGALYTVNTTTGAATQVGTVAGSGIDYGIAFNPVPDALRIVNASNQNLRITMLDAVPVTNVDTPLAYAAGDRNFGVDPTVTAVAYTNQNPGPQTMTTLFGLDAATDSLVIQSPANAGILTTVGLLGVDLFDFGTGAGQGFDIDGASGTAFASLTLNIGSNGFYTIDLTTGAASFVGDFGINTVRDIAVFNGVLGVVDVPAPASLAMLGFGLAGLVAVRRRMR